MNKKKNKNIRYLIVILSIIFFSFIHNYFLINLREPKFFILLTIEAIIFFIITMFIFSYIKKLDFNKYYDIFLFSIVSGVFYSIFSMLYYIDYPGIIVTRGIIKFIITMISIVIPYKILE